MHLEWHVHARPQPVAPEQGSPACGDPPYCMANACADLPLSVPGQGQLGTQGDAVMSYRPIKKLFHMGTSSNRHAHAEEIARQRREASSTFRTGIVTEAGELFLAVPRELSILSERVLRYERVVSRELGQLLPLARGAAIRGLVVDEVVSTNDLEGVYSTRRQIDELLRLKSLARRSPDDRRRFGELARLYLDLSDAAVRAPQTPHEIRAIYDQVMGGEPLAEGDAPDGQLFRTGEVEIIGRGSWVVHRGLHPEGLIIEAMERMLALCNSDEMPATFGALVGHFVFEYAHPFYDGNGRTGRYLLALQLREPLSAATALSLSRVIAESRSAYYRAFAEAEHPLNHGELTFFRHGHAGVRERGAGTPRH